MVYFIAAKDGSTVVSVKIGFTKRHPEERLRALQTASPFRLELISVFDGDAGLETAQDRTSRRNL
jgi:hypothetical protein